MQALSGSRSSSGCVAGPGPLQLKGAALRMWKRMGNCLHMCIKAFANSKLPNLGGGSVVSMNRKTHLHWVV